MSDDIIDFKSEKNRRATDNEQQRWNTLRAALAEAMLASKLSSGSVTSAAINALLSVIDVGEDRHETIQYVIDRLAMLERLDR